MRYVQTLCAALALCLLLAGCGGMTKADGLETLCADAGLDLQDAQVVSDADSHDGFQGDGVRLTAVRFDAADLSRLDEADGWQSMPLSDELDDLLREGLDGVYPSDTRIPAVQNGFWYFLDRCDPRRDDYAVPFAERGALNFTAAVLDAETLTLYYLEVDT